MGQRSKVFLPPWMRWFIMPILLLVWAMVTYDTFGTAGGPQELGLFGWLGITLLLALIGGVVWLMAAGKLPAYVIEHEDDERDR